MDYSYIKSNAEHIRRKISDAQGDKCVSMVAAVKYADIGEINYLIDEVGVRDIGENRVQQLLEHYEGLGDKSVNIHFIGTLQTNKVKYIADKVCMIHSLDSERLALEIEKQSAKRGKVMDVLVEINIGAEDSKSGVGVSEAAALCERVCTLEHLRLCGFMTMAPRCSSEEYIRYFTEVRELAEDIWQNKLGRTGHPLLSMGMSESFAEAIQCGADFVRIGSSLFVK